MHGPLSIIHCLRAPIGGLFRHVCDLATAQTAMGHNVGLICDSRPAGDASEAALRTLAQNVCSLGVIRVPMPRRPGPRDWTARRAVQRFARDRDAQILHGHGAKGGAYARLAGHRLKRKRQNLRVFYTPHGGSLHYTPGTVIGNLYMGLERRLARKTDGLIFESAYSAGVYQANVGPCPCEYRVIPNGLRPEEFYELVVDQDAADFVFVGELRHLKGLDVLLRALVEVRKTKKASLYVAGSGPDEGKLKRQTLWLKLGKAVTFGGALPAGVAFTRGRCLVFPSRQESMPYVVLEAAGARLPLIATNVGGIPEIVEGAKITLIPPEDVDSLAREMLDFLNRPKQFVKRAAALQEKVSKRNTADGMARSVTHFYATRLLEPIHG